MILQTLAVGWSWQCMQMWYLIWVKCMKLMEVGYGIGSWQCWHCSGMLNVIAVW